MSADSSLLSSRSFYGSGWKRKNFHLEQSVEKRLKDFKKNPLPDKYNGRITGPSPDWDSFYKQQEAFQHARNKSKDLHVFAYESELLEKAEGQRMFVAVGYPVFWHTYSRLNPDQRHHYEVIPEGSVCKLYFDLEFSRELNPNSNGSAMTGLLIKYVCRWLEQVYQLKCDKSQILELDSSSDVKFSRHLVFLLPSAAFKDNIHVGSFVLYIFGKLTKYVRVKFPSIFLNAEENNLKESLHDKPSDRRDLSKDLQTLIPNSSHKTVNDVDGRDDKLHIVSEISDTNVNDETRAEESESSASFRADEDRFIKLIDSFNLLNVESLFVRSKHNETVLFCDTGVYTKNRNFRLYLSSKLGKNTPLVVSPDDIYCRHSSEEHIFMNSLISNVRYNNELKILTFENRNQFRNRTCLLQSTEKNNFTKVSLEGYRSSPYPEIDEFITSLLDKEGVKGSIRHWTYFSQGELLLYEIAQYRWCQNVQRHHKSNNIMYIADLLNGVYYQKCHDPECRSKNYKSPDQPLPEDVVPAFYFKDEEDAFNEESHQTNSGSRSVPAGETDKHIEENQQIKASSVSESKQNPRKNSHGRSIFTENQTKTQTENDKFLDDGGLDDDDFDLVKSAILVEEQAKTDELWEGDDHDISMTEAELVLAVDSVAS